MGGTSVLVIFVLPSVKSNTKGGSISGSFRDIALSLYDNGIPELLRLAFPAGAQKNALGCGDFWQVAFLKVRADFHDVESLEN